MWRVIPIETQIRILGRENPVSYDQHNSAEWRQIRREKERKLATGRRERSKRETETTNPRKKVNLHCW